MVSTRHEHILDYFSPHTMIMTGTSWPQQAVMVSRQEPRQMSHSHHHRAQAAASPSPGVLTTSGPEPGMVWYLSPIL